MHIKQAYKVKLSAEVYANGINGACDVHMIKNSISVQKRVEIS